MRVYPDGMAESEHATPAIDMTEAARSGNSCARPCALARRTIMLPIRLTGRARTRVGCDVSSAHPAHALTARAYRPFAIVARRRFDARCAAAVSAVWRYRPRPRCSMRSSLKVRARPPARHLFFVFSFRPDESASGLPTPPVG